MLCRTSSFPAVSLLVLLTTAGLSVARFAEPTLLHLPLDNACGGAQVAFSVNVETRANCTELGGCHEYQDLPSRFDLDLSLMYANLLSPSIPMDDVRVRIKPVSTRVVATRPWNEVHFSTAIVTLSSNCSSSSSGVIADTFAPNPQRLSTGKEGWGAKFVIPAAALEVFSKRSLGESSLACGTNLPIATASLFCPLRTARRLELAGCKSCSEPLTDAISRNSCNCDLRVNAPRASTTYSGSTTGKEDLISCDCFDYPPEQHCSQFPECPDCDEYERKKLEAQWIVIGVACFVVAFSLVAFVVSLWNLFYKSPPSEAEPDEASSKEAPMSELNRKRRLPAPGAVVIAGFIGLLMVMLPLTNGVPVQATQGASRNQFGASSESAHPEIPAPKCTISVDIVLETDIPCDLQNIPVTVSHGSSSRVTFPEPWSSDECPLIGSSECPCLTNGCECGCAEVPLTPNTLIRRQSEGSPPCASTGRPFMPTSDASCSGIVAPTKTIELHSSAPEVSPSSHLENSTKAMYEALSAKWLWAGRGEHASIASFNMFSLQLVSLGAPLDLLYKAQLAALEEVEHARLSFAIASHYQSLLLGGGDDVVSIQPARLTEPIDLSIAPSDVEAVAVATTSEGCVDEMASVLVTAIELAVSVDPTIAQPIETDRYLPEDDLRRIIIRDESKHAALAWQTVRWIVSEDDAKPVDRPTHRSSIRNAVAATLNRKLPGAVAQLTEALIAVGGIASEQRTRFLETAISLWSWLARQCDVQVGHPDELESMTNFVANLSAEVAASVDQSFESVTFGAMLEIVHAFLHR